jgi:hypothetical protein
VKHLLAFVAVCTLPSGAAAADDLERQLAEREATLRSITSDIDAAYGPEFHSDKHISVRIKKTVFETWIGKFGNPAWTPQARGVSREGDLAYRGGLYRIWIERPANTTLEIPLRNFHLEMQPGQISLSAFFLPKLVVEAKYKAGLEQAFINCVAGSRNGPVRTKAVLAFGEPVGGELPYVARLVEPASVPVFVECHGGGHHYRGLWELNDVTRELDRGRISLLFSQDIPIDLPLSPPLRRIVHLEAIDQSVRTTPDAIEAETNVRVTGPPAH